MKSIVRLAGLLALFSTLGTAETWSGALVDAKCYGWFRGNSRSSLQFVDRNTAWMISYCAPSLKTGCFEVVPEDGGTFPLDSYGNAQAWALVRKIGRRSILVVQVNGEKKGKDILVSSLTLKRVLRRNS
jgi:hypothetical protein